MNSIDEFVMTVGRDKADVIAGANQRNALLVKNPYIPRRMDGRNMAHSLQHGAAATHQTNPE
jgi:hypothetical protein